MSGSAARPVFIDPQARDPDRLPDRVAREARDLAGAEAGQILRWAADLGDAVPLPGSGRTSMRWSVLASAGAQDLTVARVLEPHLDALAILAEAETDPERPPGPETWGVWAAEGPGTRLTATADPSGLWTLHGEKPWCSLAGDVTHGLVTAWIGDDRRLFAVETRQPTFTVQPGTWVPNGLARVTTTPVTMTGTPARPVGATGWYLRRDGFWRGGIGVAAVWFGGAVGLARRLARQVASREPDQVALMHLGEVDAALAAARAVLAGAAADIDSGRATDGTGARLAARARHVVASAVETVERHVSHELGPGPLSQEPEHAARVADLALYVRQHHAERDAAALGRLLCESTGIDTGTGVDDDASAAWPPW